MMIYGFIDESGSPGVAINNSDYFLVSLVLFNSKTEVKKAELAIARLKERLGLSDDYEFHFSKNSSLSRRCFVELLSRLNYRYVIVFIKKNNERANASYERIAKLLLDKVCTLKLGEVKIEMDTNPLLYVELKKELKKHNMEGVRIRQVKSHTSVGIQVADYITGLSGKKMRKGFVSELYTQITEKML